MTTANAEKLDATQLQTGNMYYYNQKEQPIPVYASADPDDNKKIGIIDNGDWFLFLDLHAPEKETAERSFTRYIEMLVGDTRAFIVVMDTDKTWSVYDEKAAAALEAEKEAAKAAAEQASK